MDEIKEILKHVQTLEPKIVVITDGNKGSYAIDENKQHYHTQCCSHIKIVERTGAGDAYATGFLAATIHGLSISEAMMWGSHNAASVIGHIGGEEGLLTKEKMEKESHSL